MSVFTAPCAPPNVTPRDAMPADAAAIRVLIDAWADHGLTLRRTEEEILSQLDDFAVAERHGEVIACAAMDPFADDIAEIRSVAVSPSAIGSGAGRAVLSHLIDRARERRVWTLVLLTKTPGFFERLGFAETPFENAPRAFADHLAANSRSLTGRTCMTLSVDHSRAEAYIEPRAAV